LRSVGYCQYIASACACTSRQHTLLSDPVSLVYLQRLVAILPLDCRIGSLLRIRQLHLLPKHLIVLQQLDCFGCLLGRLVDYESLAFSLDVLLCDDVDDGARGLEDIANLGDEDGDFGALVEILDLY